MHACMRAHTCAHTHAQVSVDLDLPQLEIHGEGVPGGPTLCVQGGTIVVDRCREFDGTLLLARLIVLALVITLVLVLSIVLVLLIVLVL